jgi:hypothetical protein
MFCSHFFTIVLPTLSLIYSSLIDIRGFLIITLSCLLIRLSFDFEDSDATVDIESRPSSGTYIEIICSYYT